MAALIQGVGGNPECKNVTIAANETDNTVTHFVLFSSIKGPVINVTIVITYLYKEVYPQCASLARGE